MSERAIERSPRRYSSSFRAEQAAATRERVVSAAVDVLADSGAAEFTVNTVAQRAGVSLRTAYRYFPTRDALYEGVLAWIEEEFSRRLGPLPDNRRDYADSAPAVAELVYSMERVYRALLAMPDARAAQVKRSGPRHRDIERLFSAELKGLDNGARARFAAVVHLLSSSTGLLFLFEQGGMSAPDAGRVLRWAIDVLADAAADPKRRGEL